LSSLHAELPFGTRGSIGLRDERGARTVVGQGRRRETP
jgi:hypothetical protein